MLDPQTSPKLYWSISKILLNNKKIPNNKSLTAIDFSSDDILKIIRNLDPNKAQGHDMISIRMVKICDDSICKVLKPIFQSCLESGKFPSERKKSNVVPVHKQGDK